ncbi:MAG: hypothetical protein CVU42_08115 [Chloroflexi bacterium HGW-Chloroflexi-4]|jgi:hypothetical protein|nr:MAG: hypothetical protein CVU42_08115 [Chloroflexi bacterium HGW-Chloroflexi-4]
MGYGNYSQAAHDALLKGRTNIPAQQVFKQSQCHPLMNPHGVKLRESRDGTDHPQSLSIVFALDVTGSMGDIPRLLATKQLPVFMKVLMGCEIPDPQLMFMAVGDAYSDSSPLQVGQFESTAELMDQWLTWSYLEGGGGGTGEESYELGMYFLAAHTELDCMVKRKKRGYLFMTGDEYPYAMLPKNVIETVIGDRLDEDLKIEEIVAELQKTYNPFFIIPDYARANRCERRWRDLLGDNVLVMDAPEDVCYVAAGVMLLSEGRATNMDQVIEFLVDAGLTNDRTPKVVATLKPYAEVVLNLR